MNCSTFLARLEDDILLQTIFMIFMREPKTWKTTKELYVQEPWKTKSPFIKFDQKSIFGFGAAFCLECTGISLYNTFNVPRCQ